MSDHIPLEGAGKGFHHGRKVDQKKWDDADYWKNLEKRKKAEAKKAKSK